MNSRTSVRQTVTDYLTLLQTTVHELDLEAILRVRTYLLAARELGRTIYLAGNDGSAATASHWASDLGLATSRRDARPIRVICLNDRGPWLTALANDAVYDRAFSGQLAGVIEPGDVLVVFSADGHGANLIDAVSTARSRGAMAIAFLGCDGGALKTLVHDSVWLPTPKDAYFQVEDVHLVVCHLITASLADPDLDLALPEPELTPDAAVR